MRAFKFFIYCIAVTVTLTGCSDEQTKAIKVTFDESVEVAERSIERAVETWRESDVNLCELTDDQWANFVGGLSTGTAITGALAGDSIIVLLTSAGSIAVVAPAVATGVTVAAGTVAATYGGIKGYCQLKGVV
ncbi:MAG: hypothetical protein P8M13_00325 [Luminiphilus sp.]|nr:hypothetical protein [Luminiphilus sp.]